MDLSEQEQAIVEGGLQAEALLGNPTFVSVIQGIGFQCFEAFMASNPHDTPGRENAYNLYQGLKAIEAELRHRINQKDQIAARLDAEDEDLD
ncbi:hypothetical protein BSL82_03370 [Tardibacter chloracetimidivorans]|uniref:Uncharacterized protein n=1 Tax=Tardibacter chloracetimidivorans TaxID=1921510 RepID=A0A1L3ZS50_9SPHN|nr:hypothetical protein [Tardibacter chloracetimidivorans]API58457.1 hypothetical protein BSL82_03370 [Tardibacter chloracetimidivorans]